MIFKKSQGAIEFIMLIGTASMISIIFIYASFTQMKELSDTKELLLIKDITMKVQSEIHLAAYAEDGYHRVFYLPSLLDYSINYTSLIEGNDSIVVYSSRYTYMRKVPKISGQPVKGDNTIQKTGGELYLN